MIHGRLQNSLRMLAMFGLALAAGIAQAQNAIESLNVSQQGATVILKINLKNEPGNPPAGFLVANPPRVALDFPNTINALGRNSQEIGQGELRSLSVVQVGDRSRIVVVCWPTPRAARPSISANDSVLLSLPLPPRLAVSFA